MLKKLPFISRRSKRGFTLIELLVVIAIVAMLGSTILGATNASRRRGRDGRRIGDLQQIRLELELYFDTNRSYPIATTACLPIPGAALGLEVMVPAYATGISRDPSAAASCYRYATAATLPITSFHLGATLEDPSSSSKTVLANDADANSLSLGWTNGFVGTDPIYDLREQ